jgi:hypothetical protein
MNISPLNFILSFAAALVLHELAIFSPLALAGFQ